MSKGLSKNYVAKNVGMKSARFSALALTIFQVNRVEHQDLNQELPFSWVFGVQLAH